MNSRYPGSRPFDDNFVDRLLFFGREQEKQILFHKILSDKLVILFAKSGIGKTSLINAGVCEDLRQRGYMPLTIRFNLSKFSPIETVYECIKSQAEKSSFDYTKGEESSIDNYFKTLEFWSSNDVLMTPVLILDQFEEFFTIHSKENKDSFITDLARLISDDSSHQPDIKVLISLREDYLAELDDLSLDIPNILQNRMRLLPLNRQNAKLAITEPAKLENNKIQSATFEYSPLAVEHMLNFLCKQKIRGEFKPTNEVEPFQLQLLCSYLEKNIAQKTEINKPVVIQPENLGGEQGMKKVMEYFYESVLLELDTASRKKTQKLCEEFFINSSDRRMSREVEEIEENYGVDKSLLEKLVQSRLLRSEPRVGSDYYELCHDTMIAPIRSIQKRKDKNHIEIDNLLKQAREFKNQNSLSKAIEEYSKVLKIDDKNVDAYVELASVLEKDWQYQEALKLYQKAIDNNIKNSLIYNNLGKLLIQREKFDEAIDSLKEAVKINNNFADAHTGLGMAYSKKKKFDDAIDSFEIALKIDKANVNSYTQLMICYIEFGNPKKAIDIYQQAIELSPKNAHIYKNIKDILKDKKDFVNLEKLYAIAAGVKLEDASYYVDLAYFYDDLKQNNDIENNTTIFTKKVILYEKAIALDPKFALAYNNLGTVLYDLGRKEEAIEKYEKAIALDPKYAIAYNNLGNALSYLGRKEEAIEKYEKAIALDPKDANAYYNLGIALDDLGRKEEAIEKYEKAIALDPKYAKAYNNLGIALSDLGRKEEAIEKYEKAIALDPKDAKAYYNLGNALDDLGRKEEAIEKYEKAIALDPKLALAKANFSELYLTMEKFNKSL